MTHVESIYEHAGGAPAISRFVEVFYAGVLVEFGTEVAVQNSWATTDAELHPLREVPKWTWAEPD